MNARKLALALQIIRDKYYVPADGDVDSQQIGWLIDPGTVIVNNCGNEGATYNEVKLTYPNGSVYVLSIEERKRR